MENDSNIGVIAVVFLIVWFLVVTFKCRLIKILFSIIENNWYRFAIKPFALAMPSATLACYKLESLKKIVPETALSWIDEHAGLVVLGYFLVPVVAGIEELVRKKAPTYADTLPSEGFGLLLKAIDYPVDKKMNRFLTELGTIGSAFTSGQVFQKITDPDRQLAEIVRAIHIFFDSLSKASGLGDIEFTTALFKMVNGVPVESWCFFPEASMPGQNLLKDSRSLASCAAKSGKMVIIQDIEYEKKRKDPRISKHCQSDKGSAISIPITSPQIKGVPLVLRITADKAFFSEDKRVMYKKTLELFKKRILIEYALSELKNYAS